MPRFARRKNRGKANGRRKKQSKLADKKINTLIEKRMQQIAKKEDAKSLVRRVLRQFPNGTYTFATNAFVGLACNNTGFNTEVCQIVKVDGVGALDIQGKRIGNQVLITGFQLLIRYALSEASTATPLASFEGSNISYALVGIRDAYEKSGYTPQTVSIDDVCPWYPWGYSPKIDEAVDADFNKRQRRVFMRGSIKMSGTEDHAQSGQFKKYVKLKRHLVMDYLASDTSSQQHPLDWKFYLALRSNVPDASESYMIPNVVTCLKTFYHEPL